MSNPTITGDPVYGMAGSQNIPILPYNDLDVSGPEQAGERYWMGPSIGWTMLPRSTIRITSGGLTVLQLGPSIVSVNFAGGVQFAAAGFKGAASGTVSQATLPGRFVPAQITIRDGGGYASTFPIMITAGSCETISGLPFVQISGAYGAIVLQPDPINGGSVAL
jgi:hypothetical protein